jgi:hypothetical protein
VDVNGTNYANIKKISDFSTASVRNTMADIENELITSNNNMKNNSNRFHFDLKGFNSCLVTNSEFKHVLNDQMNYFTGEYAEDILSFSSIQGTIELSLSIDSIQNRLEELLLLETEICKQVSTGRSRDVARGRAIIDDYCEVNDFAIDGTDSVVKGAEERVALVKRFIDTFKGKG